jgi:Ca-activated chloride channel family protein
MKFDIRNARSETDAKPRKIHNPEWGRRPVPALRSLGPWIFGLFRINGQACAGPEFGLISPLSRCRICGVVLALGVLTLAPSLAFARPGSARELLRQGNRLYGDSQFAEAVNKYNEVLVEQPQAVEPKFNKANSYYRLDDLGEAMDLYQQVAAQTKNMSLVAKAKYNLGNCYFQRGTKQRDSDLQKAIDDMETSIATWRQVLEIEPQNAKAAKNIEVARLTIKDLLDQLKKQQEQQKNGQNQQNQPGQQKQQQGQSQDQARSQQDPNRPQDPNQAEAQPQPDPNQPQPEPQPKQGQPDQPQEMKPAPDATAREILDNEQRQKQQRDQLRQRGQYREVEKDW